MCFKRLEDIFKEIYLWKEKTSWRETFLRYLGIYHTYLHSSHLKKICFQRLEDIFKEMHLWS